MKKDYTIRTQLGLTQEEIAMLLGVSRSRWSMFEIGKRDLPLPAQQLLAEMLVYINAPETANINPLQASRQQTKRTQLELLLKENHYQQVLVSKRIKVVTKKHDARLRLAQLVEFITTRNEEKGIANTAMPMILARKASEKIENEVVIELVNIQMKQELLVLEKLLLESQLRHC